MPRRVFVCGVAVAMLAGALAGCRDESLTPSGVAASGASDHAAFEATLADTKCPAQVDNVLFDRYSCQFLTVRPASEGHPAIRLLVTKVEPSAGNPPADPVIVVGEDYGTTLNYAGIAPAGDRMGGRTLYFLNPRGVDGSEPALTCPGVDALAGDILARGAGEEPEARWLGAVQQCHADLTGAGIDLESFGADAMPADVLALVGALGLASWDVGTWGSSSKVALRLASLAPAGLRAVVLDSPSVPADDPRTVLDADTRRGLTALFADCAADPVCRRLPHSFRALDGAVARLDATPVTVRLRSTDGPRSMLVDGTALLRLVRQALALNGENAAVLAGANIPAILAAVDPLDPGQGQTLFGPFVSSAPFCDGYLPLCPAYHRTTLGVYLTELCRNHDPFPVLEGTDALSRFAADSPYVHACDSWPVEVDPHPAPTTVTTDVPVLAFVGRYTPYSDVRRVRAYLAGDRLAHVVEVPGWGHNAIAADPDCMTPVRKAFIEDPRADLDLGCVDHIRQAPDFATHL